MRARPSIPTAACTAAAARAGVVAANRPLFLRPIDRTALHEANYEEPINWPVAGFHPHTDLTVCLPPRQTASLPLAH